MLIEFEKTQMLSSLLYLITDLLSLMFHVKHWRNVFKYHGEMV